MELRPSDAVIGLAAIAKGKKKEEEEEEEEEEKKSVGGPACFPRAAVGVATASAGGALPWLLSAWCSRSVICVNIWAPLHVAMGTQPWGTQPARET